MLEGRGDHKMDNFFIARKLMGIPLVTARQSDSDREKSGQVNGTDEGAGPVERKQEPNKQSIQVGKRDANSSDEKPSKATGETMKLLFGPSSITASTASLVSRKKVSTTTRRPNPTSSRARFTSAEIRGAKPAKITTTSTTRRPIPTSRPKNQSGPRTLPSTSQPEVSSTNSTSTTAGPSTTSSTSSTLEPVKVSTVRSALESAPTFPPSTTSTRSPLNLKQLSHTVTYPPGYQRRTSQSISTPRYTSKPNQDGKSFAGEYWTLFNRPDGGYSMFEVLAFASNVMILSTIVIVIMFNWIKSIRNRRAPSKEPQQSAVKQPTDRQDNPSPVASQKSSISLSRPTTSASQPIDLASNRTTSKISLISSGPSFPTSTYVSGLLDSGPVSKASSMKGEKPSELEVDVNQPSGSKSIPLTEPNHVKQTVVDPARATTATSKAMAIVQPTENPKDQIKITDGVKPEPEKKSTNQQSINRSPGDALATELVESKQRSSEPTTDEMGDETKRVAALEQLFNGSKDKELSASNGAKSLDKVGSRDKNERVQSSCSLDSIELPLGLVENLNGPKEVAEVGAPSPNLLLGQVEEVMKPVDPIEPKELSTKPEHNSGAPKREDDDAGLRGERQSDNRPKNPVHIREELNNNVVPVADLRHHQVVVVNKLDKRKTNLEIVDIRDDSVTGKMRSGADGKASAEQPAGANWISMDGVAVVQQQQPADQSGQLGGSNLRPSSQVPPLSPSEIIETRFNVDYSGAAGPNRRRFDGSSGPRGGQDSQEEEKVLNNIESELEQDNRSRNRKYFVYIVHDGHFTAKKECIARLELPPKRRITLAEMRHLIASSSEINQSSLKRSKFKFVTETYRLLNEDEDAAALHQVYPTQGVFLKLNVPEQESQYALRGARSRLSGGGGAGLGIGSGVSQATIASRRRARRANRPNPAPGSMASGSQNELGAAPSFKLSQPSYGRSISNVQRRPLRNQKQQSRSEGKQRGGSDESGYLSGLGANVISGAKRLFSSTFLDGN